MPTPLEVAVEHQKQRTHLTAAGTVRALRLWGRMDVARLDESWDVLAPEFVAVVTAAQAAASRQSAPYLSSVARHYGGAPTAAVVPEAFGGVMLDGREIGAAMFGAVTKTKELIGLGMNPAQAFKTGSAFMATITGSAISDSGRQSDITLATGRHFTRYIRVLSPGACSRCAVLAGKGSLSKPFLRHPRCKCTTFPMQNDSDIRNLEGFYASGNDYFESLSPAEQDRVFTKSGAFAIRNGADPGKVVNARRGYYGDASNTSSGPRRLSPLTIGRKADGSPLRVFVTSEGTTYRGSFGRSEIDAGREAAKTGRYRRSSSIRLMPEQIQIMAGDNPGRARELLTRYGYLA